MSKEFDAAIATAEAAAEKKQAAEDVAHQRFAAARAEIEAKGGTVHVTDTPEFHAWMAARRESDEAWGTWAMAMDAKAGS